MRANRISITANGKSGIMMLESRGRCSIHCEPIIQDRIIVDNGEVTTVVGQPVMADSLVQGH